MSRARVSNSPCFVPRLTGPVRPSVPQVKAWIMPDDYDHSVSESQHLIHEADANRDGVLSKEEILDRYDLFVGSQATDFGAALHDEL